MNGIDLLLIALGFLLLLAVVELWDRYRNWSEWDRDRRLERRRKRYKYDDALSEKNYRVYLRGSSSGFTESIQRVNRSIERFNKSLRGSRNG